MRRAEFWAEVREYQERQARFAAADRARAKRLRDARRAAAPPPATTARERALAAAGGAR